MRRWWLALALLLVPLSGCAAGNGPSAPSTLSVSSPTIQPSEPIPREHTCDHGASDMGRSPALDVTGVPDGTQTVALIVDDPDAPRDEPFVHWLVWNAPASGGTVSFPEGSAPSQAAEGENDAGSVGYTGPCPPQGDGAHTYRFTAYAVDRSLDLEPGSARQALETAMEGHVLSTGRLSATYDR